MSTIEFDDLKQKVTEAGPVTTDEVRVIVDEFFKGINWSLLKDEWTNRMNDRQRDALCSKLLVEAVISSTARHRILKLDEIDPNN